VSSKAATCGKARVGAAGRVVEIQWSMPSRIVASHAAGLSFDGAWCRRVVPRLLTLVAHLPSAQQTLAWVWTEVVWGCSGGRSDRRLVASASVRRPIDDNQAADGSQRLVHTLPGGGVDEQAVPEDGRWARSTPHLHVQQAETGRNHAGVVIHGAAPLAAITSPADAA
jgi:hypothetical protein